MKELIKVGDLVVSTAGRDKGDYFLVVNVENNVALIVNGKSRKVTTPKSKNVKHLMVLPASLIEIAERIQTGKPIGNQTVHRAIVCQKQKLQED